MTNGLGANWTPEMGDPDKARVVMEDLPPPGTTTYATLYTAVAGKLLAQAVDSRFFPDFVPPRPSRRHRFFSWLGRFFDTLAERYR